MTMTAGIVLARRPGSRWLFRAVLLAAALDVVYPLTLKASTPYRRSKETGAHNRLHA
jgi:hypothetical protein